jgi:hypothetical protein
MSYHEMHPKQDSPTNNHILFGTFANNISHRKHPNNPAKNGAKQPTPTSITKPRVFSVGYQFPNIQNHTHHHQFPNFLTLSLLHPLRFEWAKAILESRAWKMIISDTSSETNITFSIPAKCPSSGPIDCSLTRNDELQVTDSSPYGTPDNKYMDQQEGVGSTSALHRKRAVSEVTLVIYDVRRSERLKVKHQGFKSSPCASKRCICCNTNPPTLSKKVIKCLGKEFCNIPDSVLNDETMSEKPATKKATGPRAKQSKKDKGKNKKVDDDNAHKKSKKQ